MLIIRVQCNLPGRKEEKEESFNLLERVRLMLFVLCYAEISALYQNYVLPLFFQEQCKLSWLWLDGFPCFFHSCLSRALVIIRLLSRALQAIRENKVKERWNIFDTKSVLKTSLIRWHERTSVQMQTSYSSFCKTSWFIWPSFSGGWVHSDYFNRAERSNGDTNRGEVSNGSNIAQLNLTQPMGQSQRDS